MIYIYIYIYIHTHTHTHMLTGSEDERVRAAIELLFKKAEEGSNGGRTGGGGWLPLAEACDLLLQNQLALDSRWEGLVDQPTRGRILGGGQSCVCMCCLYWGLGMTCEHARC